MKKVMTIFGAILFASFILTSCGTNTKKREFCDCVDVIGMITDEFTLSQKELEEKAKGCEWIEKEMSQLQIMEEMAKCQ